MDVALTPISGLWIAYTVAAAALIFLVLRARPVPLGNVALIALLAQQVAVSIGGLLVQGGLLGLDIASASVPFYIVGILLWSPVIWLAGPLLVGNVKDALLLRAVGVAGSLPSLVATALYFLAPEYVLAGAEFTLLGQAATLLAVVGFAFTVFVLAREALTTPLPVRRSQMALLAAAFSVEGSYHAAQVVAKSLFGFQCHGAPACPPVVTAMSGLALLGLLGVGAWALYQGLQGKDPEQRRWARILAGFIAFAGLTGVVGSPLTFENEYTELTGAIHALWDLAGIAFIVYAGMRFQLFSLERRAKQSVAVTAAVGLGFIAFNSAQELAEQSLGGLPVLGTFLEVLEGFFGASASGVFAALFVGVVSIPVGKAGFTVAHKLFPHVVPTEDYEHHRKLEIYQAALEGAFADGLETPKEVASLTRLRTALGITDEEHETLEVEIRMRINKPLAPGQRPTVGIDEPTAHQAAPSPPPPAAAEEPVAYVPAPAPPPAAVAAPAPPAVEPALPPVVAPPPAPVPVPPAAPPPAAKPTIMRRAPTPAVPAAQVLPRPATAVQPARAVMPTGGARTVPVARPAPAAPRPATPAAPAAKPTIVTRSAPPPTGAKPGAPPPASSLQRPKRPEA